MFTHTQVWRAIDDLAKSKGLSTSGLAKRAGLDPTSFNKSKRVMPNGRNRWPSTESVAKILQCTQTKLDVFLALMIGKPGDLPDQSVPLIGLAQAGGGGFFDDAGFPVGGGWDRVDYPAVADENAYALEITGDSMMPVYRDGDIIVVSPSAQVRRGDRVVVKTTSGEVLAKSLQRQTGSQVELASFNPDHETRLLKNGEIDWIARIVWASQ